MSKNANIILRLIIGTLIVLQTIAVFEDDSSTDDDDGDVETALVIQPRIQI